MLLFLVLNSAKDLTPYLYPELKASTDLVQFENMKFKAGMTRSLCMQYF